MFFRLRNEGTSIYQLITRNIVCVCMCVYVYVCVYIYIYFFSFSLSLLKANIGWYGGVYLYF